MQRSNGHSARGGGGVGLNDPAINRRTFLRLPLCKEHYSDKTASQSDRPTILVWIIFFLKYQNVNPFLKVVFEVCWLRLCVRAHIIFYHERSRKYMYKTGLFLNISLSLCIAFCACFMASSRSTNSWRDLQQQYVNGGGGASSKAFGKKLKKS